MMKKIHYSWIIMVACFFLLMSLTGATLACNSAFLKPISTDLGISRATFSSYTLVSGIVGMFASINAGAIIKKLGVRKTVIAGALMIAVALLGYSISSTMPLFWIFGAIAGFGGGFSSVVVVSYLLNNWFVDKKGLATSVAFMGTSTGTLVFSRVAANMLPVMGWRNSLRVFAVYVLVSVLILALFLVREHPKDKNTTALGYHATTVDISTEDMRGVTRARFIKSPVFILLALAFGLSSIAIMGVQNHLLAFMDDLNYSTELSSNVFTTQLICQMAGKILLGILLDKIGTKWSMVYITVLHVIGMFGFVLAAKPAFAFIGAVGLGLSAGICTIIPPYVTSIIVGKRDYANIIGAVNIFVTAGVSVSTTITSVLYESSGYSLAWIVYAVLMIITFFLVVLSMKLGKKLVWE